MSDAGPSRLKSAWPAIVGLLAFAFAIVVLRTAWVSDDAFITLRVVDNLVHGYGPRWNVAERVQAFTHPLWFLLLLPTYVVTGLNGWLAALLLGLATSGAGLVLLARRVAPRPAVAAVLLTIAVSSRALVDYSTAGLENPLGALFAFAGFLALLRDDLDAERRARAVAWCAGLAALNRLDALVLFAPALAWCGWSVGPRRMARLAAAAFAPLATWLLFSVVYYGSPWPNTALAKLGNGVPAGELVAQGLRYVADSLQRDPLTLACVGAALVAAAVRRRPRELIVAAGLVLHLVYVVRAGGDFMSGRFFSVPLAAALVLLARGALAAASDRVALACVATALAAGFLADGPNLLSGRDAGAVRYGLIGRSGIADERRYYFPATGMFNGADTWRRPVDGFTVPGRSRRGGAHVIATATAIGVFGYYAGPAVHVVDVAALSDPLLARLPAVSDDATWARDAERALGAPPATRVRVGHYFRNVPPGYLRSLVENRCVIEDPQVNALCERVWRVARGRLFDPHRFADAWSLAAPHPLDLPRTRRWPPSWREVLAVRPTDPEAILARGELLAGAPESAAQAAELLLQALSANPDDYNLTCAAGRALSAAGRPGAALALAEQAIAREPNAPNGYWVRADALAKLGRIDDTLADLATVVRVDPLNAHMTYYDGAVMLRDAGRTNEALAWLDRAAARGTAFERDARAAARAGRPW